ncbi:MAG: GNAT family N-acetyltransferase [Sedimentitalea sp.]
MALELNDLETKRFGVTCAKLTGTENGLPDLDMINKQAADLNVEMLTTRLDVSQLAQAHELESDGYRLMDTLVYYRRPHDPLPERKPLPNGLTLRDAVPADSKAVAKVSLAAFEGYFGHYHADPRLSNDDADEAYLEWAEKTIERIGEETHALVVENGSDVVGFCSLIQRPTGAADIELNGILPSSQGRGLYARMIEALVHKSKNIGADHITVSTQINNYAVQRVWTRLGFYHERSAYTFHKWFT